MDLSDVLAVVGFLLLVGGIASLSIAAAAIVAGIVLLGAAKTLNVPTPAVKS